MVLIDSEWVIPVFMLVLIFTFLDKYPQTVFTNSVSFTLASDGTCVNTNLSGLNTSQQKELMRLAVNFYGPQARAIVGLLFNDLEFHITKTLSDSLNPVTVYKLNVDYSIWPKAAEWNIR